MTDHPGAADLPSLNASFVPLDVLARVCLRTVTPASIVAKSELMDGIERLTAEPSPDTTGGAGS
jgi:hypothetical protein